MMAEVYEPRDFLKSQSMDNTDSLRTDEIAILVGGCKSLINIKIPAKSSSISHHLSSSPSSGPSILSLTDGSPTVSGRFDPVSNFNIAFEAASTDKKYEFSTEAVDVNYQYGHGAVDFGPSHLPLVFEPECEPRHDFIQNLQPPTLLAMHETSQDYMWTTFVDEFVVPP